MIMTGLPLAPAFSTGGRGDLKLSDSSLILFFGGSLSPVDFAADLAGDGTNFNLF
jgi:hypothetical protein